MQILLQHRPDWVIHFPPSFRQTVNETVIREQCNSLKKHTQLNAIQCYLDLRNRNNNPREVSIVQIIILT